MKSLRKTGFLLWLAFALAIGQHAGLLHGLAHAAEKVAQKQDSKPAPVKCEQCSLVAQLTGLSGTPPQTAFASGDLIEADGWVSRSAPSPTRVAFRSRAPPVLL